MGQRKEEHINIDGRANRYALRCFCVTMAGLTLAWIMNQLNIFIVDKRIMTIGFCVSLGLFTVCLVICHFRNLDEEWMKYVLLFFIIGITTVIQIMLTYHTVLLSALPIIYSAMYQNTKKMTIYTYILTIFSIVIIVFGGYHFGLCDANMALLTREPLAAYISDRGLFNLNQINPNPVLTLSLYFVFPRALMCGVFVPVGINISQIIAKSRLKEEEMRVLAEIDGMTGLYNKSKYLEQVANPYMAEEKLAVIYWDVNGLKTVNDTLGHEHGDKLIMMISDSIKQLSSPSEKAYRVGGDEFVMILRGGDETTVKAKLARWEKLLDNKIIGNSIAVTASVGYACGSGAQMEELIQLADERMYENKREFYNKR